MAQADIAGILNVGLEARERRKKRSLLAEQLRQQQPLNEAQAEKYRSEAAWYEQQRAASIAEEQRKLDKQEADLFKSKLNYSYTVRDRLGQKAFNSYWTKEIAEKYDFAKDLKAEDINFDDRLKVMYTNKITNSKGEPIGSAVFTRTPDGKVENFTVHKDTELVPEGNALVDRYTGKVLVDRSKVVRVAPGETAASPEYIKERGAFTAPMQEKIISGTASKNIVGVTPGKPEATRTIREAPPTTKEIKSSLYQKAIDQGLSENEAEVLKQIQQESKGGASARSEEKLHSKIFQLKKLRASTLAKFKEAQTKQKEKMNLKLGDKVLPDDEAEMERFRNRTKPLFELIDTIDSEISRLSPASPTTKKEIKSDESSAGAESVEAGADIKRADELIAKYKKARAPEVTREMEQAVDEYIAEYERANSAKPTKDEIYEMLRKKKLLE